MFNLLSILKENFLCQVHEAFFDLKLAFKELCRSKSGNAKLDPEAEDDMEPTSQAMSDLNKDPHPELTKTLRDIERNTFVVAPAILQATDKLVAARQQSPRLDPGLTQGMTTAVKHLDETIQVAANQFATTVGNLGHTLAVSNHDMGQNVAASINAAADNQKVSSATLQQILTNFGTEVITSMQQNTEGYQTAQSESRLESNGLKDAIFAAAATTSKAMSQNTDILVADLRMATQHIAQTIAASQVPLTYLLIYFFHFFFIHLSL